jgi:hypothetical protein
MTLLELITHLRTSILDDTGGSGVDWTAITEDSPSNIQLRWSNEELTRFINEALRKACRGSYLIKDYQAAFDISVVADTNNYSIDSRIIKIKEARLLSTGKRLEPLELEEIWDNTFWEDTSDTPQGYIIDHKVNTITLYPNPIVDDTVKFIAYREEMAPLDWDNEDGEPEIAERYQLDILHYAAFMAFMKDEANTLDPNKAKDHLALFTAEFSSNSAHAETRRGRSRNRGVAYGGIG